MTINEYRTELTDAADAGIPIHDFDISMFDDDTWPPCPCADCLPAVEYSEDVAALCGNDWYTVSGTADYDAAIVKGLS
jgi:hypothetical protein